MNVFKQFIRSLYSPKDIATFRNQGIGKTILYIFVLILITSFPAGIQLANSISTGIQQLGDAMKNELPDFEMRNGILISELEEPLISVENNEAFIFDTTGTITPADLVQYDTAFALLEREALVWENNNIQTYRYRDFGNINFTKTQLEDVYSAIQDATVIIISLILLLLYILLTGLKFIGVLVLSVIGLLFRKGFTKRQLPYRQIWALSAYAVTLPTTVFALIDYFAIHIPLSFAIYWGIAIFMLHLVIKEIPKPTPKPDIETEQPSES